MCAFLVGLKFRVSSQGFVQGQIFLVHYCWCLVSTIVVTMAMTRTMLLLVSYLLASADLCIFCYGEGCLWQFSGFGCGSFLKFIYREVVLYSRHLFVICFHHRCYFELFRLTAGVCWSSAHSLLSFLSDPFSPQLSVFPSSSHKTYLLYVVLNSLTNILPSYSCVTSHPPLLLQRPLCSCGW